MSVAVAGTPDRQSLRGPSPGLQLLSLVIAVAVHGAGVAALLAVDPAWVRARDAVVEMEVAEALPAPAAQPAPPPPPEPEPPPKVVPRRVALARPAVTTRGEPPAPPPPNQEPPPNPTEAPPVFGVTMSSVVSGDSAVAVPVGNSTMTKARAPVAAPAPAYAAEGTRPFTPVAELYVASMPVKISEANSEEIYPGEAKRMGIEGKVELRLGIDEKGAVREARVLTVTPAGYDFEVNAREALLKNLIRFSPARTSDGKAVPVRITYTYRFELGQ